MDEVIVRYYDLPYSAKGVTVLDENGDYNIYINSRFNHEQQQKAKQHELRHIKYGDFYSKKDIKFIEHRAG